MTIYSGQPLNVLKRDGTVCARIELPPSRLGFRFDETSLGSNQSEVATPAVANADLGAGLSEDQQATITFITKNWDSLTITIANALVAFYSSLIWDGCWDRNPVDEFGVPAPQLPGGTFLEEWVRPKCFYLHADRLSFGVELHASWSKTTIGLRVKGVGVIVCPAQDARHEDDFSPEVQAYFRRTNSWWHDPRRSSEKITINPLRKSGRQWLCDLSRPRISTIDGWNASLIERSDEKHCVQIEVDGKMPSAVQTQTASWLVESSPTVLWNVSKAVCHWLQSSAWKSYWIPRPDDNLLAPAKMIDHIQVDQVYLSRSDNCIGIRIRTSWSEARLGVMLRPSTTHIGSDVILSQFVPE